MDALQDSRGCQLISLQPFPRKLVPALLQNLHLSQQCHQPRDLQPHVSEIPCSLQKAVQLQAEAHRETCQLQCGSKLQRHQGVGPVQHGAG